MRSCTRAGCLAHPIAALVALLASCALAAAGPPEPEPVAPDEIEAPAEPLSPEAAAALRDALNFDAIEAAATHLRTATPKPAAPGLDWKRTDKLDGSAAFTVKRPLPTAWDASIGADFGLPAAPAARFDTRPGSAGSDTGAAWASIKVPGVASIDTRVDAGSDQNKFGTGFSRSLPVGGNASVMLQNSYAVSEPLAGVPAASVLPGTATAPSSVWSTERMVKFNIGATGTTFAAGQSVSTADTVRHSKLSAEQKLFDQFNVTTTLTDVGTAASAKSISAGFKLKW